MEALIAFIAAHYDEILAAVGAVVGAASIIVKITPTQTDDAILAKVVKVLDYVSIFNPKGTKVVKDENATKTEVSLPKP